MPHLERTRMIALCKFCSCYWLRVLCAQFDLVHVKIGPFSCDKAQVFLTKNFIFVIEFSIFELGFSYYCYFDKVGTRKQQTTLLGKNVKFETKV